jgi:hypothetical protein
MKNVLIHYAAPWVMTDEKTGKVNSGYSLQFITPYTETREGAVGYRGTKTSIRDQAVFEKISKLQFPIIGDLELEAKPGADGKLTAVVIDIKNAKPVALFKPA